MNLSILCSALCLGLLAIETSCFDKEKIIAENDGSDIHAAAESVNVIKRMLNDVKRATGCNNDDAGYFANIGRAMDGYDVMKGYPNSGALSLDPGIKHAIFHADYTENSYTSDCKFRIPDGIRGYMSTACKLEFKSETVRNSQEHSDALKVGVEVSGGGFGVEFSASAEYGREQEAMEAGEKVFIFSNAACTYYSSRLNTLAPPQLDSLFVDEVKKLITKASDVNEYYSFIGNFGTHVPIEVTYGSRLIKRYEMTAADYMTYQAENVDVAVQASYSGTFSVGGGASYSSDKKKQIEEFNSKTTSTTVTIGSTPPAGGEATEWASETKDSPVPIKYQLMPISEVFQSIYFEGTDVSETALVTIKQGMEDALNDYCEFLKGLGQVTTCVASSDVHSSLLETLPLTITEVGNAISVKQGLKEQRSDQVSFIGDKKYSLSPKEVARRLGRNNACFENLPLISGSQYNIPDSALDANYEIDDRHAAKYSRLNECPDGRISCAWVGKEAHPAIWADLGSSFIVAQVATQGRGNDDQWVTSFLFIILYSQPGVKAAAFYDVPGNSDSNTVVVHDVGYVKARIVQLNVGTYHKYPALRFEVYGCPA